MAWSWYSQTVLDTSDDPGPSAGFAEPAFGDETGSIGPDPYETHNQFMGQRELSRYVAGTELRYGCLRWLTFAAEVSVSDSTRETAEPLWSPSLVLPRMVPEFVSGSDSDGVWEWVASSSEEPASVMHVELRASE